MASLQPRQDSAGYDLLVGQFVLAAAEQDCPGSWTTRQLGSWYLATHPRLPVADLQDSHGVQIGWLLGHMVTPRGEFAPRQVTLTQTSDQRILEDALYAHAGRWLAIIANGRHPRMYLDPAGSLAAVYALDRPLAASTPSLIPAPPDTELRSLLDLPRHNRWYPAGLTSKTGVNRLLPNHYLDLGMWTVHRHRYGKPVAMVNEGAVAQPVDTIRTRLKHIINSVGSAVPVALPLTAGQDSRVLLACSRTLASRVHFFTIASGTRKNYKDVEISRLLSRRLKLKHQLVRTSPTKTPAIEEWAYVTGYCAGGEISRQASSLAMLDRRSALLPGVMGELARAYYWRAEDAERHSIDAATLIERVNLPTHPRLLSAMEQWLAGLADLDVWDVLDLLYLEFEGGCWGGPQHYGTDPYVAHHLMPFVDRALIDAMLALPRGYRKAQRLTTDLCNLEWPETLRAPINELTPTMRIHHRLRRLIAATGALAAR